MATAYVGEGHANNSASATTLATASGVNVTAGNLIVGAMGWDSTNTTVSGIADTAGNTYTLGTRIISGAFNDSYITPFWCINATGNAANIVTGTLNAAATFRRIAFAHYSGFGIGTKEDEDVFNVDNGDTAITSYTTPSLTLTGAGIIIGIAAPYSTRTMTPGGSFVERLESGDDFGLLDFVTSSDAAVSLTFSGTTFGALIGLSFKEAAATARYNMLKGM